MAAREPAAAPPPEGAGRPTGLAYESGRSVVMAPHGMVATSQPLAAQVGLEILRQGGNAVDAAIAANACIGLTEPMSCGIGGDLFAIVWDAGEQKLHGLNASGRSPRRATREFFAEQGLAEIPFDGPLSWSVPGCVDGWDRLRTRFGTLDFGTLLASSIGYAEEGFPVSEVIARSWQSAARFGALYPDTAATYLIEGRPPRAGEVFRNPGLARSYREIAEGGRDAFYQGRIAQEIVAYSEANGGLFSMRDLAEHTSTADEPVSVTYRGVEVWELPPPGQGIAALQMLNLLEAYDLAAMGPDSPDWWHLFLEAKKLVFADRATHYCDPAFAEVPVAELVSRAYADHRRAEISMDRAHPDVSPGDPKMGMSDTIYLCAVDRHRNCCSLIQSNYSGFGSGMAPRGLGFALQNRGTLFALDEAHANRLEPGRRPFHTIIPAMATRNGKPWLTFGVMGGDMQPQGHVQVLVNLLDFGMNLQQAGEAPRMEHRGSATPTGRPHQGVGVALAEPGIPPAVVEELTRRGHVVERTRVNGGGYQAIMIEPDSRMLHGASEARKDGCAVGY